MATILDETEDFTIVKFSNEEFNQLPIEIEENINDYEIVFDKPIKTSEFLKLLK